MIRSNHKTLSIRKQCDILSVPRSSLYYQPVPEKPEIINSDQGSLYTSFAWIHYLEEQGIQISMDSKGRAIDNIWIERFWKSIKYNYIYLNPCDNGLELFEGVREYIEYYNQKKPNDAYQESICQKAA